MCVTGGFSQIRLQILWAVKDRIATYMCIYTRTWKTVLLNISVSIQMLMNQNHKIVRDILGCNCDVHMCTHSYIPSVLFLSWSIALRAPANTVPISKAPSLIVRPRLLINKFTANAEQHCCPLKVHLGSDEPIIEQVDLFPTYITNDVTSRSHVEVADLWAYCYQGFPQSK